MAAADLAPGSLDDDEREAVEHLLFRLADDEFVLAERYTEWQVRAPTLESDLAVSNIAQDELGHARLWFAVLEDLGHDEAALVWERPPGEWHHATLAELPWPEGGWADAIVRGYLYDVAEKLRLEALEESAYAPIRDRVGKVQGEEDYHIEHAQNWLERLADGEGGEGTERLQAAIDRQFGHALTLFEPGDDEVEARIDDLGLRTRSLAAMRADWLAEIVPFLESLGLTTPVEEDGDVTDDLLPEQSGRDGDHTGDWADLYDELTATYDELDVGEPARIMDDE